MADKSQLYQQIVCKFLLNLPKQELDDSSRISYQAQKAFYYYLDYVLKSNDLSDWRKLKKEFFMNLKDNCPPFIKFNPSNANDKILQSKPVCGALVFNKSNTKVLVIRVENKLGFPKGKQNQGETLEECAIREVQEETGISIANRLEPKTRIDFINHEGKIYFFVARGVFEQERVKVDRQQIDEVLWMKVEDVRRDISTKFAERSKIAWAMYDRDWSSNKIYMPKYYQKETQNFDYSADPLRHFKLDHKKLTDIFSP